MGITNLGAVGISAGGVYNPETVYKKYKVVSANGGSYMYINPTPAAGVPVTDTSHWQQIASVGGQDLVDAAVAAKNTAVSAKDTAVAAAAQLQAGIGSPAGKFANLAAVTAANPAHDRTYLTENDWKIALWDEIAQAWVAGGVYQATAIAEQSVTPIKTNFFEETDNILVPDYCINNYDANTSTGALTANNARFITDYIAIPVGETKISSSIGIKNCFYYDINKTYISAHTDAGVDDTIVNGSSFVRLSYVKSTIEYDQRDTLMVHFGTPQLPYIPSRVIQDRYCVWPVTSSMYNKLLDRAITNNGFRVDDFELGTISNGNLMSSTTRVRSTGYIFAEVNDVVINNDTTNLNASVAYYDLDTYAYLGASNNGFYSTTLSQHVIPYRCYIKIIICYRDNRPLVPSSDVPVLLESVILRRYDYNELVAVKQSAPVAESISGYIDSIGQYQFSFNNLSANNSSDITFIAGNLYVATSSDDANLRYANVHVFDVDFDAQTVSTVKTITHNLGHCNTIDYCVGNDSLILGSGSSDSAVPNKIMILSNPSGREAWNYSDCLVIDVSSEGWGIKLNVVWGEHNYGQYNICYAITNNNRNIRKLLLSKTNGVFDGGYTVLDEWETTVYLEVNQGSVFRYGRLFLGLGHSTMRVVEYALLPDGEISMRQYTDVYVDTNGDVLRVPYTGGVTIENSYILLGGSDKKIHVWRMR